VENEIVRIGIAGSIATMAVECGFHFVDTVNIRAKASAANVSTMQMLNKIWRKEGFIGFSRGFSATFYGSCITGFFFFMAYKKIKMALKEKQVANDSICELSAGLLAECAVLGVQYPYDLVKCRLQSSNGHFKY
jgi:solute carrier family 25 phosphate transporter 23/24/25/41